MKTPLERRLELRLRQRDVAAAAGVAGSSVSHIERNMKMHELTKHRILSALERLETEKIARMYAEDQPEKPRPACPVRLTNPPITPATYVPTDALLRQGKSECRACKGTGVVWSPQGLPFKCPYCGGS